MTPQEELERLVDLIGIENVLDLLAVICDDKAEHLAVNWQDVTAAKKWAKYSTILDKVIVEVIKIGGRP